MPEEAQVVPGTGTQAATETAAPAATVIGGTETAKPETGTSLVGGKPEGSPAVEDIKLKIPDGVEVDKDFMGNFMNVAKELGLKSEAAQKLVDLHLGFVDRLSKEFEKSVTDQSVEWYKALEKDPDFGGTKLNASAQAVHKVVQKFGGEEFKAAVDEMGLGNWPPLVKLLARIGAALGDDNSATGEKPASTPADSEEAFHRALYDKTPQLFHGSR